MNTPSVRYLLTEIARVHEIAARQADAIAGLRGDLDRIVSVLTPTQKRKLGLSQQPAEQHGDHEHG